MKRRIVFLISLLVLFFAAPVSAENRFIVRDQYGFTALQNLCGVLGCTVKYGLDGTLGQVFLVGTPDVVDPKAFLKTLLSQPGVTNAELDQLTKVMQSSGSGIPPALWDSTPVTYFGNSVRRGYVTQPAVQIIRLADAQGAFNARGSGIVAVIDTGVDPNHPVLKNVLVSGYDFTRNQDGIPAEQADLDQSAAGVLDQSNAQSVYVVNQSAAGVLDQSAAGVLDGSQYSAFGHGTMVAGIIHLVAPKAMIMPLKAFKADGTGYTSDVLRAIYRGVQNRANVLNMSFSFPAYSQEMQQAVSYANRNGVISVASTGNDGKKTLVYPAALDSVMGVASTTNDDALSTFSNYGQSLVWVGAPGEGVVTTYPFGTYAAAWGTSFSTPFVAGTAALLLDVQASCNQTQAAQALSHAKWISSDLGNGRLDVYQAVQAWRQVLGMQ